METICKNCGASFVPKNKNQVCCNKLCSRKYSRLRRLTTICPKHQVKRNQWYHCAQCEKECGRNYNSSEASKKAARKYAASEKGKEVKRKISQKRRVTPEGKSKEQARNEVHKAILRGILIKQPCVVCGNPKVEAHHYLGYSKEHQLSVVFLCRKHHVQADHDSAFNETLKSTGLFV